jgi:hypothetical protein
VSFQISLSLAIIQSDHSEKAKAFISPTMKSASQSQSQTQSTSTPPVTLSDILMQQALSSNAESPVLPSTTTKISPESKAAERRKRLLMILDLATDLIESEDFDAIESSTTHQWPRQ